MLSNSLQSPIESPEIEKSCPFSIADTVEYVPAAIINRTLIKKITGIISAVAFSSGESLEVKISPFDTFVQVIEGKAEIIINEKSYEVGTGQAIVVPAHSRNTIKAISRFKMLSFVIKSGYEELS
jgi:quercetin dioxygenase-like cupin family protein